MLNRKVNFDLDYCTMMSSSMFLIGVPSVGVKILERDRLCLDICGRILFITFKASASIGIGDRDVSFERL